MKRGKRMPSVFAVATTALLSVVWQAGTGECCIGGRYGRYENWPSNNDWDELLMLITGNYGKNGWGWTQQNSYAYSSLGDYPSGTLKYSSSPWGSSGSSSSSSQHSSSQSSNSLYNTGYNIGSASKLSTDKIKDALNSYFRSKPSTSSNGWSNGGGGGGSSGGYVGQSFMDTPRPGPPYDDSPGPGPPYPPLSHDNSAAGPFGPTYDSSWPGGGPGDSSSFSNSPPLGGDPQSAWPLPQGSSTPGGTHQSSPLTSNFLDSTSPQSNSNGGGGGNQFQSDYDTFGGGPSYGKKRRRQGRRRVHNSQPPQQPQYSQQSQTQQTRPPPQRPQRTRQRQAGLRSRPINSAGGGGSSTGKKPFKFPPYPGSRGKPARKQRRMGPPMSIRRRKLKTSFGGYKVDFSRIRFG